MIDFTNRVFKLKPMALDIASNWVACMLLEDEPIIAAFTEGRDSLLFTTRRMIAIDVQGPGGKTDYTSLPYSRIQAFSVETSGVFVQDSELTVHFSSIGPVKFALDGTFDVKTFNKVLGSYLL